ncbi:hypothetical protein [Candidatus Phytoplasma gossypii]|uniref:Uncharacterized protein n=1 Tax=Candidatus Phytoplasma gossypii TaxID=2982629 RepID=A0ABT9D1J2_9MOLU|nr:hypothetical protein ['Gossypium sp.' phytoplasma]MDO8057538.1 hypothetical protein ['Gossypium sp.' phytoplasma]
MAIITKKKCQNGNLYIYYSNGKIKTIKSDGTVTWKTKNIKTKKTLKGSFFIEKGEK